MIVKINDFLLTLDKYLGSSNAFVFLLIGTGVFFTFYLGFPQIRYFGHALRVVAGKYDRRDKGDTSHLQALGTSYFRNSAVQANSRRCTGYLYGVGGGRLRASWAADDCASGYVHQVGLWGFTVTIITGV
jgi:hypothetical protein